MANPAYVLVIPTDQDGFDQANTLAVGDGLQLVSTGSGENAYLTINTIGALAQVVNLSGNGLVSNNTSSGIGLVNPISPDNTLTISSNGDGIPTFVQTPFSANQLLHVLANGEAIAGGPDESNYQTLNIVAGANVTVNGNTMGDQTSATITISASGGDGSGTISEITNTNDEDYGLAVIITNGTGPTTNIAVNLPSTNFTEDNVLTVKSGATGIEWAPITGTLREGTSYLAAGSTAVPPTASQLNPVFLFGKNVGNAALNSAGGGANVAIGYNILTANVGTSSGGNGANNTVVGSLCLTNTVNAGACTAVGTNILQNTTTAIYGCTGVGFENLITCTGDYTTSLGYQAGSNFTSGTNCTFLGAGAMVTNGDTPAMTATNSTCIGSESRFTDSNQFILGNQKVNVGIGTYAPTYGLHLGPTNSPYTPTIYVTASGTPPAPAEDDVVLSTNSGQVIATSTTGSSGPLIPAPSDGVSGQFLALNSDTVPYTYQWMTPTGSGASRVNVISLGSGPFTYTPTPGMIYCLVQLWGGGGGSGSSSSFPAIVSSGITAGYTQKWYNADDIGSSVSGTVGARGVSSLSTTPPNGGNSTFLGLTAAGGGTGTTTTGGDFNYPASEPMVGLIPDVVVNNPYVWLPLASPSFMVGKIGRTTTTTRYGSGDNSLGPSTPTSAWGQGGSAILNNDTIQSGNAGVDGRLLITEFIA